MKEVREINDLTEFEEIIQNNAKVMVDVYAEWCGPCRLAKPEFERLAREHPDICFIKVDSDEGENISSKYGIQVLPTFLSFVDGKVKSLNGGFKLEKLKNMIQEIC